MTANTVGHLLVAAAVAWIAATEVLRFLHRRDRRRQVAARAAPRLRIAAVADRAACARVDLLSDAACAAVCATFEPDFQVQP